MSYLNRFPAMDALVAHLDGVVPALANPVLKSNYVGFLNVSVVTVFELSIKDILVGFADKKHKAFGAYCASVFERLNGRISIRDLKEAHIQRFGAKYVDRFEKKLILAENASLLAGTGSVRASYGNVIVWRNKFAHEGFLPPNASYAETKSGYFLGKEVLRCLFESMVR